MGRTNDNLQIVMRLAELARNPLDYNEFPKSYKDEHIFLANALNDSLSRLQHDFDDKFKYAVGNYKQSLENKKGYGWFHKPETLVYIRMQINQLRYVIYGERHVNEIKFNEELGDKAYLDLINQIDSTVLMTPDELKEHQDRCNKLVSEIMKEILEEEKSSS